ncbi:MAG: CoB--CoM heterodisulfide reductase iron-sulfur subunit A family protein [Candidatus Krumholzibacteria bacterium]|nr:CoB--CoM heterodisulfide reductase iron-sulfur subunit A family protein [Candidatus Krumholzibacteria bacterium]
MKSRIGVYICECGSNISDYVDVEKVKAAVEQEEGVVLAKITMFACADSTQQEIVQDIQEEKLDGMVVASCSPKLHLGTFRSVAERAGLNRYNYVQSNIREQASWAHSDKPAEATEKAIRNVKAAIARTRLSVAMTPSMIPSENTALVVGAGIAGMRVAIDLADTGSKVYLVEKDHFVGGRTAQWGELFPTGQTGTEVIEDLYREVGKRENINLYTGCEVVSKSGSMGNFEVQLRIDPRGIGSGDSTAVPADFEKRLTHAIDACPVVVADSFDFGLTERKALYLNPGGLPGLPAIDRAACTRCGECVKICPEIDLDQKEELLDIKAGSVIIASGFDPYEPKEGEFGYRQIDNVITMQQFRRLIEICGERLTFGGKEIKSIAWIFCVGSRQTGALEGDNKYCARYCCTSAIHSAVVAKKRFGDIQNYHFTRGVRTYGKYETIYEESSSLGDIYLQSFEDDPPVISSENGTTTVKINDILTEEKELEVEPDLVVLVTGMVPRAGSTIGSIMKAPAGLDGFFNEVHPKLKPVETVIDGIFLAGTSQGPKNITETAMSAHSSAIKTHTLISKGEIELEPTMAIVDRTICEWCGKCSEACPFDAIDEVKEDTKSVAVVNEAACKGCGMCLPVCPVNAVQLKGFMDSEIEAMIDAMSE